MSDDKNQTYKITVVEGPNYFYAPYIPEKLMKVTIERREGHPGGWTDDLGIIADKNTWIKEELAGWYCEIPWDLALEVYAWCQENLKHDWHFSAGRQIPRKLYISNEKDAAWFSLRWS